MYFVDGNKKSIRSIYQNNFFKEKRYWEKNENTTLCSCWHFNTLIYHHSLHRGKKSCLVRYLNPSNHHLAWVAKADKDFAKRLDFIDIKVPVKIRDIDKIEKKKSVGISVLGSENKEKRAICVSKLFREEKLVDLLLKRKGEKNTLIWPKILISSCMIIYYIVGRKWCLVRYLNPANQHLARIKKSDKDFAKTLTRLKKQTHRY